MPPNGIYVAGPMSGLPEFNYPAFTAAAVLLIDAGFERVVNPAALGDGDTGRPWDFYMRQGIAALLTCNAVAVLPGLGTVARRPPRGRHRAEPRDAGVAGAVVDRRTRGGAPVTPESVDERRRRLSRERSRRHRARKRGLDVPWQPRPRGYTQSPEHVQRRADAIRGERHWNWQGEDVSERGGRARALREYTDIGPCVRCGASRAERHHVDGNTANNVAANIEILCRRCHMETDGRLSAVRARPYRGIA